MALTDKRKAREKAVEEIGGELQLLQDQFADHIALLPNKLARKQFTRLFQAKLDDIADEYKWQMNLEKEV